MSNLTYNIKLSFTNQEDYNLLLHTLQEHQKVWNYISKNTFASKQIDKKLIHDQNYHKCRKLFPDCPSQVIIRAKDSVYSTYKSLKTSQKLSTIQNPCFLTNLSIRLDKRLYTFLENNRIKLTTTGKRIVCSYNPYPKFSEMFSKYSLCDPLIFLKNNQFWISISFEVPTPTHIESSCVGIDVGERRLAVTSEGKAFTDKNFLKQKRALRKLKRELQSKLMTKNSHSTRTKLKKLKRKEHNKNKNLCHHLANELLKTKASTLVIEDLSSLKKNNLDELPLPQGERFLDSTTKTYSQILNPF